MEVRKKCMKLLMHWESLGRWFNCAIKRRNGSKTACNKHWQPPTNLREGIKNRSMLFSLRNNNHLLHPHPKLPRKINAGLECDDFVFQ